MELGKIPIASAMLFKRSFNLIIFEIYIAKLSEMLTQLIYSPTVYENIHLLYP